MAGLDPAIHENKRPGAIPAFFLYIPSSSAFEYLGLLVRM